MFVDSHVQLFETPWTVARQAPVHGIFQARILQWTAISFSKGEGSCIHLKPAALNTMHWDMTLEGSSRVPFPQRAPVPGAAVPVCPPLCAPGGPWLL